MTTASGYWRILRTRGLRRLYDELAENLLFDVRRGTDTQTIKGGSYNPSYTGAIVEALREVGLRIPRGVHTFYDFGCGKGKALILATESGLFARIVGVENDAELANIASHNLRILAHDSIATVEIADAGAYDDIAPDSVLYLYNPFPEETFARLLGNLDRRASRSCYLIYFDPVEEALLADWHCIYRRSWPGETRRTLAIFERCVSPS
jgi:SAM-dependent methyltransferase